MVFRATPAPDRAHARLNCGRAGLGGAFLVLIVLSLLAVHATSTWAWWGLIAALSASCIGAIGLLVPARIDTFDARSTLGRGGAVPLALMIGAATVPTVMLAITTSPSESEEA